MTGNSLIASIDPFSQPIAFFSLVDVNEQPWVLRSFWMVKDLRLVYDWLDDKRHRSNSLLGTGRERLLERFKLRLLKVGEQVLVLERKQNPIVVLELLPVRRTDLVLNYPIADEGWVVYYTLSSSSSFDRTWIVLVEHVLEKMKKGKKGRISLYIEIPSIDSAMQFLWESIGFEFVTSYINSVGLVKLYCWSS